jgi:hypothetical protein
VDAGTTAAGSATDRLDIGGEPARRLLNDLDSFRARTDQQGADESIVAHQWLTRVFEPVIQAVPPELRAKLEPAEIFHECSTRWFLSERAAGDRTTMEAAPHGLANVLSAKQPDEKLALPGAPPPIARAR